MQEDLLQKFLDVAFPLLEKKDALEIYLITDSIESFKVLSQAEKNIIKNVCFYTIYQIYYLLIQNKVYLEVNNQNIRLSFIELKIIEFLKKCFPTIKENQSKEEIYLLLKILQCLNNLENTRQDYENENGNSGRTIASSYHLEQIDNILKEQNKWIDQLKRTLHLK